MNLIKYIYTKYKPLTHDVNGVTPNPNGSEFEVNNWILSEFILRKIIPLVRAHPYPLNELMMMTGAICRFQPTHVFEWGTNIGASARIFHETACHFKIPMEIHSIDLPMDVHHSEHPGSSRGRLVRGRTGVFLHLGDGLDTSVAIARRLTPNQRLLFFIDGDHSYSVVKNELEVIFKNFEKPVVMLHDTFFQSCESGYNVGPFEAIRDVLKSEKHINKFTTNSTYSGLPGMTIIYPKQKSV